LAWGASRFPLKADRIIWVASANDISGISASILDRLLILRISDPSEDHLHAIIDSIYATANGRYGCRFDSTLAAELRHKLLTLNPRRIGRLFDLAFARAAADGRFTLDVNDVAQSEHFLQESTETHWRRNRIGFIYPLKETTMNRDVSGVYDVITDLQKRVTSLDGSTLDGTNLTNRP
jgi:hypothetical protein